MFAFVIVALAMFAPVIVALPIFAPLMVAFAISPLTMVASAILALSTAASPIIAVVMVAAWIKADFIYVPAGTDTPLIVVAVSIWKKRGLRVGSVRLSQDLHEKVRA